MTLTQIAGRYRVLGRIAAGGMGEVYRATMESAGGVEKRVAIKLVRSELASDPAFAALFVDEARIAMSLSHANVVQSFDVGRIDDRWFLAMEDVDGVNLSVLIQLCKKTTGVMPLGAALFVAVEALKGLDYAHRRKRSDGQPLGIVHRDVSPSNLLVSFEGEVKVADFGIAKTAHRTTGSMVGAVKGKVPYMAPEQLRAGAVDRRADLFAMGAVLYEMLTGQRRVEGNMDAIPAVLDGKFPRPRELRPEIPEELEAIVMKALAADQNERYPSAAAMRQEIESFALRRGLMLSSSDLAELLADHESRARTGRQSQDGKTIAGVGPTELAPTLLAGTAAAGGADEVESVRPTSSSSSSSSNPFDSILGRELCKIETNEPFSVFITGTALREPIRSDAFEDHDDDGDPIAPALLTGGYPLPQSTPKRLAGIAIMLATAAVLGTVALVVARGALEADVADDAPSIALAEPTPPSVPEPSVDAVTTTIREPEPSQVLAPEPPRETPTPPARNSPGRNPTRNPVRNPTPPIDHDTRPIDPVTPPPVLEPGRLSVNTDPWSFVAIDGTRVRATPLLGYEISPGRHRLDLENPAEHLTRTITVEISAGEHRRVTLDLRE